MIRTSMIRTSSVALVVLALAGAASPALAQGWRHHGAHYRHHYYGWYPTVSDYYHHSRMLVGTR
jgi:hypothetical protein